eukprot:COSAG05_NODE_385_length_10486_cov_12.944835_6_plen_82_part_00
MRRAAQLHTREAVTAIVSAEHAALLSRQRENALEPPFAALDFHEETEGQPHTGSGPAAVLGRLEAIDELPVNWSASCHPLD